MKFVMVITSLVLFSCKPDVSTVGDEITVLSEAYCDALKYCGRNISTECFYNRRCRYCSKYDCLSDAKRSHHLNICISALFDRNYCGELPLALPEVCEAYFNELKRK